MMIPGPSLATYYGGVTVPGAKILMSGGDWGDVPGAANAADYAYANETAIFGNLDPAPGHGFVLQWIITGDFTNGGWTDQTRTLRNITLPPDDAEIPYVYLDIRWHAPYVPDYSTWISIDGGMNWLEANFYNARTVTSEAWDSQDITGFATWTPPLLKSDDVWVRLIVYSYEVIPLKSYYLDYAGINYIWSSESPPEFIEPPAEWTPGLFTMPDAIGIMGMTGFIGMIAIPATSIWFFQRDGGSKIYAVLGALTGFLISFGMFAGAIGI